MAFGAAIKAEIQRYVVGALMRRRAEFNRGQALTPTIPLAGLARTIQQRFGDAPGASPQAARGQAQLALRLQEIGQTVNRRPVNAVPLAQLPSDPALTGVDARVRYEVFVSGFDRFGNVVQFRTEILANDVLSGNEIRQRVNDEMADLPAFHRPNSPSIVTDGTQPAPTITILSAGRRP